MYTGNKILITPKSERCIGCGLCAVQASIIQHKKIDLSKSFIKITSDNGKYNINIDYGTKTDYDEIVKICPRGCFDIKTIENTSEE